MNKYMLFSLAVMAMTSCNKEDFGNVNEENGTIS